MLLRYCARDKRRSGGRVACPVDSQGPSSSGMAVSSEGGVLSSGVSVVAVSVVPSPGSGVVLEGASEDVDPGLEAGGPEHDRASDVTNPAAIHEERDDAGWGTLDTGWLPRDGRCSSPSSLRHGRTIGCPFLRPNAPISGERLQSMRRESTPAKGGAG